MKTYVDKNYLVAGDTILCYTCPPDSRTETIDVPARFDNKISVRKIGRGAFSHLPYVRHIKLPPGITHIEADAFHDNPSLVSVELPGTIQEVAAGAFRDSPLLSPHLKDITLYDIKLSTSDYQQLKADCFQSADNRFISRHIPPFIPYTLHIPFPAAAIPADTPVLFRMDARERNDIHTNIDHFDFAEGVTFPHEHAAFTHQITTGQLGHISPAAEQANDFAIRSERPPSKWQTLIFTFDDTKTRHAGNHVYVTATFTPGFFFYPYVQKVICNKQDYFVCSRIFLTPDKEFEFVKEDVTIYRGPNLVQDRKEAQLVYGKYKLLSIL